MSEKIVEILAVSVLSEDLTRRFIEQDSRVQAYQEIAREYHPFWLTCCCRYCHHYTDDFFFEMHKRNFEPDFFCKDSMIDLEKGKDNAH